MKINFNLITAIGLTLLLPAIAWATDKAEICAKFKEGYGWSKGYAVQGTVISGSDLNSAVGSYTRFKSFSTYIVVFWDKEQATIFELPTITMGSIPMFETEVEDQQGRKWKIKEGHLACY